MSTTHMPKATISTTAYGRERITVGDYALVIVPRVRSDRHAWKPTRLYGAIDTLGGELRELLDANSMKPVIGPGRDDFANDAERNSHVREYRSLKRRLTSHTREQVTNIFKTFTDAVPHLVGVSGQMKFSSNAGCTMCPCSPGFIMQRVVLYRDQPVDLWIESTVEHEVVIDHSDY